MSKNFIPSLSRPTWVEIHLNALKKNFHSIKNWSGKSTAVMGIVKADAYGHGAGEVAKTLQKEDIDFFGVASLEEAMQIHRSGVKKPVLILGYTPQEHMKEVIRRGFRQTLFDMDTARKLNHAAQKAKKQVRVHIKLDTGMGRLGCFPENAVEFICKVQSLPNLIIEGVFTHFSSADGNNTRTKKQLLKFNAVLHELKKLNITVPFIHAANSAAILNFKEAHFNMIRPGILLYGLSPLQAHKKLPISLYPVLSLKTRIISLKKFSANKKLSYSGRYTTRGNETIAVVPIGYADGYLRALSNKGEMIVRGRKAPVVGNVCMDFTLLNVSAIPRVQLHDEVTIIGQADNAEISVNDVASRAKTINYEITCLIGKRIPRVYV